MEGEEYATGRGDCRTTNIANQTRLAGAIKNDRPSEMSLIAVSAERTDRVLTVLLAVRDAGG